MEKDTTTSSLLAEARAIAGRPSGALRLVLMRLRQERPEDVALRAAFRRPIGTDDSGVSRLLRSYGYRPHPGRPRVWGRG